MLFHDQALFKPANGRARPLASGQRLWRWPPASLVSCWLTLDDADRDNGAMQVIPGGPPQTHLARDRQESRLTHSSTPQPRQQIPGSGGQPARRRRHRVHPLQTLHYTQPNTTDRQRRAFAIHFMPPGTRWEKGSVRGIQSSDAEGGGVSINHWDLR